MAKFELGDWVKVIPTPDTRSDVWTSNHNKFCDRIGQITDINDLQEDLLLFRVTVHFDYKQTSLYGSHSAWFEDKHVVKSSKWEHNRVIALNKEYDEYMRTENNIKKRRDDMLREVFSDPYVDKDEPSSSSDDEYDDDMEKWVYGDGWYMRSF